jgi:DNA-binding GntR family transcriptional regulator
MDRLIKSLMVVDEDAPLGERAHYALRSAIVRCDFAPGAKLKVEALTEQYGFSSSPLREALTRLAQEGLVQSLENRGFRVAPISRAALDDLTHMRLLLETDALANAVEQGGDEWEARVVAAFHRLALIEQRLDLTGPLALNDDWSTRHKAYHLALFSGCDSPLMVRTAEMFFVQAERYRRFSALHRKPARNKKSEHQALMNAALARKKGLAVDLLREHIMKTTENVAAALDRMGLSSQDETEEAA